MVMPRYAHRIDANQAQIMRDLRKAGLSVIDLSAVGGGVPDLLVSSRTEMWLMELKTATGRLNQKQLNWWDKWQGKPVHSVRTSEDALKIAGVL